MAALRLCRGLWHKVMKGPGFSLAFAHPGCARENTEQHIRSRFVFYLPANGPTVERSGTVCLFIRNKNLYLILYSHPPHTHLWKLQVSQTLGLAWKRSIMT